MELGLVDVFPKLEAVPKAVADSLQDMVRSFEKDTAGKSLELFGGFGNLSKVVDEKGQLQCLFKVYPDDFCGKTEVSVFLLDHCASEHRPMSLFTYGVPPTVYIKTKEESGCLVRYMESDGTVGDFPDFRAIPEEIQKACILDIRFGKTDGHERNILVRKDANGIHRLIPIDHEDCFSTDYQLRDLWWVKQEGANVAFAPEMKNYVEKLDADKDIAFLESCGWDVPSKFKVPFKVFTFFPRKLWNSSLLQWTLARLRYDGAAYVTATFKTLWKVVIMEMGMILFLCLHL